MTWVLAPDPDAEALAQSLAQAFEQPSEQDAEADAAWMQIGEPPPETDSRLEESPATPPAPVAGEADMFQATDASHHALRSARVSSFKDSDGLPRLSEAFDTRPQDLGASDRPVAAGGDFGTTGGHLIPGAEAPVKTAAFGLDADGFSAYVLTPYDWDPSPAAPAGAPPVVTWSLVANNTPFDPSLGVPFSAVSLQSFLYGSFINEVYAAFDAWEAAANIHFVQVTDGGGAIGVDYIADIRLLAISDQPGGTLAAAAPPNGTAIGGDIIFDSQEGSFWTPHNFFLVATHEIGHTIGLDHVTNVPALMNPGFDGSLNGLLADDIAGAQAIYGAPDPGKPLVYDLPASAPDLSLLEAISGLTVMGNGFSNSITGTAAPETLSGLGGNDTLRGNEGDDVLIGGSGNNLIDGGTGTDTMDFTAAPGGIAMNLSSGSGTNGYGGVEAFGNIENVTGSDFNDTIWGDGADNVLRGLDGDDDLRGFGGNNLIIGGAGSDTMEFTFAPGDVTMNLSSGTGINGFGGIEMFAGIENLTGSEFNDVLWGDAGDNTLKGRGGDDELRGFGGDNLIDGGLGSDTMEFNFAPAGVTINLSSGTGLNGYGGTETFGSIENVTGSEFDDLEWGDAGDNTLRGRGGDDDLRGFGGNNFIDGGLGNDTMEFTFAPAGVTINLSSGSGLNGFGGTENFGNVENVTGSDFNDLIWGDGGDNILLGLAGDDEIRGFGGDDIMIGHAGNDRFVLDANSGDDRIDDFEAGLSAEDVLDYSSQGLVFSDLSIAQDGADTVITNTITGDTVTLLNVTATDLNQGTDFIL